MVLVAATLWGSNGIFVKLLTDSGFSSIERTSIRLVIAVIMEAVLVYLSDKRCFKIDTKGLFYSFSIGAFGIYLFLILYTLSIARTGMGTAAVLIYLMPTLVTLYACIFEKAKFTWIKAVALVLNLSGCALVSGIATGSLADPLGILFGILAGFLYAFNNIMTARKLKKYPALTKMFYPALAAAILALAYLVVFSDPTRIVNVFMANPKILLICILWAFCCSICTYYLFNRALSYLDVETASLLSTFEPVAAVLFGLFLFNEKLDVFGMIGVVLVIVSLVINEIKEKKE